MTQADLVVFPGSVTHLLSDLGQVIWTASAFPASVRLNGLTPGTCLELCLEAPNSCLLLWPTLPSLTPSLWGVSFPFLSGQPPSTHWVIIFQLVIFLASHIKSMNSHQLLFFDPKWLYSGSGSTCLVHFIIGFYCSSWPLALPSLFSFYTLLGRTSEIQFWVSFHY